VLGVGVVLAVVGLATSQSRAAVVGAAVAVLAFLLLTVTSRRGLTAVVVTAMLALMTYFGVTTVFGGVTSVPNRYSSIAPTKVISTAVAYRQGTFALIPSYLVDYPLGDGIGSSGPAGGSARMGVALRMVAERRLQVALAALTAVFISLLVGGFVGADSANSPTSPFLWLALGTLAYWYSEMRRGHVASRSRRLRATLSSR
jgi:hypothetical protein